MKTYLKCDCSNERIEQYIPVILFYKLHHVMTMGEILLCDDLNGSY